MNDIKGFIKGTTPVANSYYLTKIADNFSYEEDQKSFALRLLIHYIGDVHQPLHAVAEVNHTYPTGDRGGNSESIPSEDGVSNLHAVWDSVIYEYPGYPDQPLTSDGWDWYTNVAGQMYSDYPIDTTKIEVDDISAWAQESLDVA